MSWALFTEHLEYKTKEFGHSCPVGAIGEYAENIGDGRSPEFRENEQKRILGLLENF